MMSRLKVYLHFHAVAALIIVFLAISSATYSACSCVRQITDHCGRPLLNETGEPLYETDQWGTFFLNWPSNVSLIIAAGLFLYFLYLEFRAFFPKRVDESPSL